MSNEAVRCPGEDELLRAIANDEEWSRWSRHVETCSTCRSLVVVAEAIRRETAAAQQHAPVPSAQWILFQAEIRRRREAGARVTRGLRKVNGFGFAAGLAAILIALYSAGSDVVAGTRSISAGATAAQSLGLLVSLVAVPVMVVVTVILRLLWAED